MAHMTKKLLAGALEKLLTQKPLDKITVTELVKECDVNRQTFYYNFQDIYDLLRWTFLERAKTTLEELQFHGDETKVEEQMISAFQELQKNKRMVLNAFHSVDRRFLMEYLKSCLSPVVESYIESQTGQRNLSPRDSDFIAGFPVLMLSDMVVDWLDRDMGDDYLDYVEQIKKMNKGIEYLIVGFSSEEK